MLRSQPESARDLLVPDPFEVVHKVQETVDTWTLELKPRSGARSGFQPGQFMMTSAAGTGEVPISISGDPADHERLVHTVRAVGLATAAICSTPPSGVLSVRGPFGAGWPVSQPEGHDVVIAAGGIGLAPLRPVMLALLDRRDRYRRVVLLYGGRSPELLLYTREFDDWRERGAEILVTVDSAGPEWLGHVGVVTRLIPRARVEGPSTTVFCCGPEVMMRFTVAAMLDYGVASDRIYVSMERNMQCGLGHCGHCQLGPTLVCRDGPVYRFSELEPWLAIREL